jgi:hypothetical protein
MDVLEGNIGSIPSGREEAPTFDLMENQQVAYEAVEFCSFSEIVEDIIASKDPSSFCFCDFDQTLTGGEIRNVRNPEISDEVKMSFDKLLGSFSPGKLCITTNRGYGASLLGNLVFKTDKALEKMVEFLEESSYPGTVPIFLGLKKQIPGLKINGRGELIDHVVEYIENYNLEGKVRIFMIEDFSLLGLDRSVFPKEIAREVVKKLKEQYGRDVAIDIKDYVLKH